jgi:CheY-like chemotaxis protein
LPEQQKLLATFLHLIAQALTRLRIAEQAKSRHDHPRSGVSDMDGGNRQTGRVWPQMPIIVLSAWSGEVQIIEAFDAGADDYLTEPFGLAELLNRRVFNGEQELHLTPSPAVCGLRYFCVGN